MATTKSKGNKVKYPDNTARDDAAFFRAAYQNDPKARASITAEMKSRGMTDKQIEARYGAKKPTTKKK